MGPGSGVKMAADGVMIGLDRAAVFPLYQGSLADASAVPKGRSSSVG